MKDQLRDQKVKKAAAIRIVSQSGEYDCHRLKTIIGRGPFCDILLSSPHVSVLHALITYDFNGSVWVKDLGSSNGVFVNDTPVLTSELSIGDRLQIGEHHFRVEASGAFVDLQKIRENTTLELELNDVQKKLKQAQEKNAVQQTIKGTGDPAKLKHFEEADDFFNRLEDESWRQYFVRFSDNYIDLKNYKPHVMQNIFHEEMKGESAILENKGGHSIEITCTSADVIHSVDYMDTELKTIYIGGFENKDTIHIPTLTEKDKEPLLVKEGERWVISKKYEENAMFLKGESFGKNKFLVSEDSLIRVRNHHVDIYIRLSQRAPDLDRSSEKDKIALQSIAGSLIFTLILFFSLRNVNYIKEKKQQKKVVAVVYKKPKQTRRAKVESRAKQKNAAPQKPAPPRKRKPKKKVVKKVKKPTPKKKVVAKPKFKLKFSTRKGGSFRKMDFTAKAKTATTSKKSFSFSKSSDASLAAGGNNPNSVSFGSGGTNSRAKFGGGGGDDLASFSTRTVVMGSMDPNAIRKILQRYLPQFRHCYQRELDLNSESVEGVVDLNFTIGKAGRVTKTNIRSRAKFSASGKNCMIKVLQKIQFPQPKGGGIVDIRQPLNFSSSGG